MNRDEIKVGELYKISIIPINDYTQKNMVYYPSVLICKLNKMGGAGPVAQIENAHNQLDEKVGLIVDSFILDIESTINFSALISANMHNLYKEGLFVYQTLVLNKTYLLVSECLSPLRTGNTTK